MAHSLALYLGSLGEGERRARYLLFAHALNYLTFPRFLDFAGYVRVMLTSPAN